MKATLCTERPRSGPNGIVSRRQAPPGGGGSGPFGVKRCPSVRKEAFQFTKRCFVRKASFCT
eukprot:2283772-Alexandrium_andersonii.AAC.1